MTLKWDRGLRHLISRASGQLRRACDGWIDSRGLSGRGRCVVKEVDTWSESPDLRNSEGVTVGWGEEWVPRQMGGEGIKCVQGLLRSWEWIEAPRRKGSTSNPSLLLKTRISIETLLFQSICPSPRITLSLSVFSCESISLLTPLFCGRCTRKQLE